MRSRAHSESADRLGDVLELLFAPVFEANVQLTFDFAVHLFGNQDAARIGAPLQPDSNIDPVAKKIAVSPDDNLPEIDPNAQPKGASARCDAFLYLNRASHCSRWTRELGQRAVTRGLDQSPVVAREARLDYFALQPLELGVSGFFGPFHKRGIADHIGREDGR